MNARLVTHGLGIAAATAGIMLATLLSFLPGVKRSVWRGSA